MLVLCAAHAQERSFGTLPLAQKTKPSSLSGGRLADSSGYRKALNVYNKLVQARGDFRFPVPAFLMTREENRVAGINYDQLEIVLEEKAYKVCATYGAQSDAAMAFLLGHELTHYYEKHAWRRGFAADYRDLPIGLKLDSLMDGAANETEADYLGGFLAYSAGYGLFDKGADLMQKLYTAYGIPPEIPGYPSLSDRQALGQRSAEKLKRLVELFDMANLLTAIGKYPEAYECYRYLLMQYQSREIYNNLGVTALLDALRYFSGSELKFRIPVQLDLESTGSRNLGLINPRDQMLNQAILHFDAAISMDPNYAPAYLNKACAYMLLGDAGRARFYAGTEAIEAAKKGGYPKTETDAAILLGILDAQAGETEKAKTAFQQAANAGSALATVNLNILLNQPPGAEIADATGLPRVERIDGKSLAEIEETLAVDPKRSVELSAHVAFHQNPKQGEKSRLFVCQNTRTDAVILFHLTEPGYTGKTARLIGLGSDRSAIVKAYGEPSRTVETPLGQIMAYQKILFILDPKGQLTRWVNFQ